MPALTFIPSEKFQTAFFAVLIHRPLKKEEAALNALLPGALRRGCAKYPSPRVCRQKEEELFGAVFDTQIIKKGERQILQFYMEALPSGGNFYRALELTREYMLRPLEVSGAFPEEIVDNEKENLRAAIRAAKNNKAEYAKTRLLEIMCADEPFGVPGEGCEEDIDGITGETLMKHYKNILEESPVDFLCLGGLDEGELRRETGRIFDLSQHGTIEIPQAEIRPAAAEKTVARETADTPQAKLCIGFRANVAPDDERFYALLTANEVIGGGANSRLFNSIREKNSLCYGISSILYRFKSIMVVQSGVAADRADDASEMILAEISSIKEGKFTDDELDYAKAGLIKKFRVMRDYPSALLDFHAASRMLGRADGPEDAADKIAGMTREAVTESINELNVDTIYTLTGEGL